MEKKIAFFAAVVAAIGLAVTSCSNDDNMPQVQKTSLEKTYTMTGTVKKLLSGDQTGQVADFDCYGMLVPSFTPKELMEKGFEYGDLLNVKIGDSIEVKNVPFVTGFNEVGVFETCFCDYNKSNTTYGFGQLHGNFMERIGGKIGDKITVTLAVKQGYKDIWEVMKSVYTCDRDSYPNLNDEEWANFRPVKTTGMGDGVLYRSSNPLNPHDNYERSRYVDSLAQHYGIKTEIDLADTDAKVKEYMSYFGYTSKYCPQLYKDGHVIALGLTADTYGKTFMENLGKGLRFMAEHEPPYLVHCNEGKDRCGFVSMLLEALAGATHKEVADDYMKTLQNFYGIKYGDASYQMRQRLSIDRLVWLLGYVKEVKDFSNIDWTYKDPSQVNLQDAAEQYVKDCGLTDGECAQLKCKLQGGLKSTFGCKRRINITEN